MAESMPPLPRKVLEAAAEWHVRLKFGVADKRGAIDAEHSRWLAANVQHQQAWVLVQRMEEFLGGLPQGASLSALKASKRQRQRRIVLKGLLLVAGTGGLGLAGYRATPWRDWTADYRTRSGERRTVQLADSGTVDINTATALDVLFDDRQRLLRLHAGEILVQTAADRDSPTGIPRPFIVQTPQGFIRALGTRFSVRVEGEHSQVAVFEHAVEIRPVQNNGRLQVAANEAVSFTPFSIGSVHTADRTHNAWTRGLLLAVDQRLGDFLTELARYRPGHLQWDAAIADLRVTGTYRIDNTDHVLDSLSLSHPIRIQHYTRYWTRISLRE